jgi:hypothetical protein
VFKLFESLEKMLSLKQGSNPLTKTRDELFICLDKLLDYGIDFRTFHGGIVPKFCMLRAITNPVVYNEAIGYKCDTFEEFVEYVNMLAQNERV